jgi:rhodanese-related sulfurtransferase
VILILLAAISFWITLNIVLAVIILGILLNQLYLWWRGRRVAKLLENDDFRAGMHKAQIIDLREKSNFDSGHILGARNMPFSQFKVFKGSLRKDMPIYLYDQGKALSIRAAAQLYKLGYRKLYILKDGFERWDGKTKKQDNY